MRSVIVVSFYEGSSPKEYEYYADGAPEELSRFTFAVVVGAGGKLSLCSIEAVKPATSQTYEGNLKPVVALFDMEWHRGENERAQKLAALERQAEAAIKKQSKISALEKLAEENPEYSHLLDEYRKLNK